MVEQLSSFDPKFKGGMLGKYGLIKTLGQGAYSKVKLCEDTSTQKHYAIKIHKADDPKFNQTCVSVVENEARAMLKLKFPGVVNIHDYIPIAKVKKANGDSYDVCCVIVEELANGGELFYYVKNSGFFSESQARYYFHQMIEALEQMHQAGICHRDLKPDNILLSDDFNIKIADFGFAGPIAGRTGTGYLTTSLGTEPYQAPEINERKPYKGEEVDLFALGIVLFIIVAGTPPFTKAD